MILILSEEKGIERKYSEGDTLSIKYNDEVVLKESFIRSGVFNYYAVFVFCTDSGKVQGNVCGMFGNSEVMPEELVNAKSIQDLTEEQKMNLLKTNLVELK